MPLCRPMEFKNDACLVSSKALVPFSASNKLFKWELLTVKLILPYLGHKEEVGMVFQS